MPEIIIKYNGSKTLKALKVLSELLDFKLIPVAKDKKKIDKTAPGRSSFIPGDPSVDISDIGEIISRNNMDAKKLRKAWQRS